MEPKTLDVSDFGSSGRDLAAADDFYDRPTVIELVGAVREFLAGAVMAETAGSTRFHARVAANVLAIVERQLAADPAAVDDFHAALAGLGVTDAVELVDGIRDGTLAGDDRVHALLTASVEAKLRVDNPTLIEKK
ncbi:DUF6285 domain-containing protein [Gordonia sp. NPDC003950]